jgi:hypothetical protein
MERTVAASKKDYDEAVRGRAYEKRRSDERCGKLEQECTVLQHDIEVLTMEIEKEKTFDIRHTEQRSTLTLTLILTLTQTPTLTLTLTHCVKGYAGEGLLCPALPMLVSNGIFITVGPQATISERGVFSGGGKVCGI